MNSQGERFSHDRVSASDLHYIRSREASNKLIKSSSLINWRSRYQGGIFVISFRRVSQADIVRPVSGGLL
jgi:hypothetical protein